MERTNRLSTKQVIGNCYADSAVELYVMTLKSDLELFKQRLPFPIHESSTCPVRLRSQITLAAKHALGFLVMQLHTIGLFLYQISLLDRNGGSENNATCLSSWPPWRLETIRLGLLSAKLLLDTYLSLPSRTEMTFNNTEWAHLEICLDSRIKVLCRRDSTICQCRDNEPKAFSRHIRNVEAKYTPYKGLDKLKFGCWWRERSILLLRKTYCDSPVLAPKEIFGAARALV